MKLLHYPAVAYLVLIRSRHDSTVARLPTPVGAADSGRSHKRVCDLGTRFVACAFFTLRGRRGDQRRLTDLPHDHHHRSYRALPGISLSALWQAIFHGLVPQSVHQALPTLWIAEVAGTSL